MTMKIAYAVAAYANAGKVAGPGLAPRDGAGGFADMLKEAAADSIDTLRRSEAVGLQAAVGKADLNTVVTAVSNAELTLQTVATIRDRVIQAYQDILRMPI
jgi:flagellar hook-basal body complex protein FliE